MHVGFPSRPAESTLHRWWGVPVGCSKLCGVALGCGMLCMAVAGVCDISARGLRGVLLFVYARATRCVRQQRRLRMCTHGWRSTVPQVAGGGAVEAEHVAHVCM